MRPPAHFLTALERRRITAIIAALIDLLDADDGDLDLEEDGDLEACGDDEWDPGEQAA